MEFSRRIMVEMLLLLLLLGLLPSPADDISHKFRLLVSTTVSWGTTIERKTALSKTAIRRQKNCCKCIRTAVLAIFIQELACLPAWLQPYEQTNIGFHVISGCNAAFEVATFSVLFKTANENLLNSKIHMTPGAPHLIIFFSYAFPPPLFFLRWELSRSSPPAATPRRQQSAAASRRQPPAAARDLQRPPEAISTRQRLSALVIGRQPRHRLLAPHQRSIAKEAPPKQRKTSKGSNKNPGIRTASERTRLKRPAHSTIQVPLVRQSERECAFTAKVKKGL
ncbi:hypothetical protein KSP39_PZI001779 [Platanthera zijinensis]|uniref:Uncharacterized protein n=1 Tax=Platanthera zijinensis TaxID=2320716 RepID=A0AAP0GDM9_9ASPA